MQSSAEVLERMSRARQELTRLQFVAEFPCPFLVSTATAKRQLSKATTTGRSRPLRSHSQDLLDVTAVVPPLEHTGTSDELVVAAIRKAPNSVFQDRISIGRAQTCDIVLQSSSVSKVHGHFQGVTPQAAQYADAKSANSTYLDGVLAQPGTSVEIHSLGLIALGRVRLQFLSTSDFYDWLDVTHSAI